MKSLSMTTGLGLWGGGWTREAAPAPRSADHRRLVTVREALAPEATDERPACGEEALEERRLEVLEATGILERPASPELDAICARAKARFGVAMALVTLVGRETIVTRGRAGTTLEALPRKGQFCHYTIGGDEAFVVPDARADGRFADNPVVAGGPMLRFYAGAPLIYFRQVRLGALCLLDPVSRDFTGKDRRDLTAMAAEAADAIVAQEVDRKAVALGLGRRERRCA